MANEIGKKLFEQIFDDALVKLYFSEDQLDLVWASIEKMQKLKTEWVILIREKHSNLLNTLCK